MSRLLSRIFGHKAGTERRSLQKKRALRLEGLEGRLVPATFVVTTFADVVNPNDGVLSLREAISKANALPGPDRIVLQAGVYKITIVGEDNNTNARGDFDVSDSLTIAGAGAGATAIEGNTPAVIVVPSGVQPYAG
jgi:CSLREA domain-containing protein